MKFVINKKEYTLRRTFTEIKIIDIINIFENTKITDEDFNQLNTEDLIKLNEEQDKFVKKTIFQLSTIDDMNLLEKVDPFYLIVLFNYVKDHIRAIRDFDIEEYKLQGFKEIKLKGKKFYFPEFLYLDEQEILPCYDISSKHITEIQNLFENFKELKDKGLKQLPYFCSLYLRESTDEIYDEAKVANRAKTMQELPLLIVFELFFCIHFYGINLALSTKNYLLKKDRKRIRKKIMIILSGFIKLLKKGFMVILKKLVKKIFIKFVKYLKSWLNKLMNKKKD